MSITLTQSVKTTMIDKARSSIILCLKRWNFERSCKGEDHRGDVYKVRIAIHDQVIGTSIMSKTTTLCMYDGRVIIYFVTIDGIQQNHWRF